MATLYITEYAEIPRIAAGRDIQVALEPPVATQTVAISGSAASSSAFNARTSFVELSTDAICSVLFGTAPVATAANARRPADTIMYHAVPKGLSYKVSVISNT